MVMWRLTPMVFHPEYFIGWRESNENIHVHIICILPFPFRSISKQHHELLPSAMTALSEYGNLTIIMLCLVSRSIQLLFQKRELFPFPLSSPKTFSFCLKRESEAALGVKIGVQVPHHTGTLIQLEVVDNVADRREPGFWVLCLFLCIVGD